MMRPRIARIRALAHALGNVEVHSAAESVEVALAGNALLNIVPPVRQYVSPTRLAAVELHECGHAKSASISGWAITKVFVRPDGTGNCLCERNADTDYASSLELVRFLLAGYASELRYPYA